MIADRLGERNEVAAGRMEVDPQRRKETPSAETVPPSDPHHPGNPSITTTVPQFGQFLAGNYFTEGKAAKLSSAWTGDMKRCSRPLSYEPSL